MTLSRESAGLILGFYDRICEADKLFRLCQSTAFKSFVQAQYAAPNVREAFDGLRRDLETEDTAKP